MFFFTNAGEKGDYWTYCARQICPTAERSSHHFRYTTSLNVLTFFQHQQAMRQRDLKTHDTCSLNSHIPNAGSGEKKSLSPTSFDLGRGAVHCCYEGPSRLSPHVETYDSVGWVHNVLHWGVLFRSFILETEADYSLSLFFGFMGLIKHISVRWLYFQQVSRAEDAA